MEWLQIIITAITTGSLSAIATLRAVRRKASADAVESELANDDHRFSIYTKIIDDLNQRLSSALSSMRDIEERQRQLEKDNSNLLAENKRLLAENDSLKKQIIKLSK